MQTETRHMLRLHVCRVQLVERALELKREVGILRRSKEEATALCCVYTMERM